MSLLEIYNKKINELEGDELNEYIMMAAPYIKRYHEETNRKDIYNEYMIRVEGDRGISGSDYIQYKNDEYICDSCGATMLTNVTDGDTICSMCGICVRTTPQGVSFQEEQKLNKNNQFSYKRQNHFNEWMQQFQGKETVNIPDEIIEKLRYELKKQRVNDLSKITHSRIRGLLKKLRENKYYEHIPYICNCLTGQRPQEMPRSLEERLRLMFNQIQEPFDKVCPPNRSNFLSYPYVLYKLCELLGEDKYLPYFPLLKSKEKLIQQDVMWKKICELLSWEFIKTC